MLAQQGRTCSCLIRALRKSRSSTWEPQRRGLLSSLTAEGRCPPVVSRPGFTRGLPAPCSDLPLLRMPLLSVTPIWMWPSCLFGLNPLSSCRPHRLPASARIPDFPLRAGGKHSARRPGIRTSAAVTVLTLIPGGQRPAVRLRLGKTLTPPEHSTLLSLFATSLVKADVNQSGDGPRSQVGSQRSRGRGLPPLLPRPPSPAVTRKCLISLINKVIFISTVLSEYQQDSLCDTLSPRLSLLTVPIEKMVLGLDEFIFADGQCDAKPT
ncbi:hypothetical protein JEQ12_000055 [Ovis aries]|uniref:Uncharacterized protein n=1 Tax=Ovis aries TaxID=9940 RepID=A0A836ACD3_SHEEP|nr:hypothetical protein JEQ12_000055 [Ovis aries]